ncbi:conserved hypothetical protein [Ricinus communis]|uniref:RNase H type-1 domain-containing protein n=1 Tax=Ricinus communis TaxID=3988 RepID=B9SA82_RICCO|nr:conserved hypothetical protein [Ricinus communis]
MNKISEKAAGWNTNLLSYFGREILLKAVLTAIPSYAMAVFKFPKSFCASINSILARSRGSLRTPQLFGLRDAIRQGIRWNVGNGEKFWCGVMHGYPTIPGLKCLFLPPNPSDVFLVRDLIDQDLRCWNSRLRILRSVGEAFGDSNNPKGSELLMEDSHGCPSNSNSRGVGRTCCVFLFTCKSYMVSQLFEELKESRLWQSWFIWKARNSAVFNGVMPDPPDTWKKYQAFSFECDSLSSHNSRLLSEPPSGGQEAMRWQCPALGTIKYNSDMAWNTNSQLACLGVIARDSRRKLISGKTDSAALVEMVNRAVNISWDVEAIVPDIQEGLTSFAQASVSVVRRDVNRAADSLAKFALSNFRPPNWLVNPPPSLERALYFGYIHS